MIAVVERARVERRYGVSRCRVAQIFFRNNALSVPHAALHNEHTYLRHILGADIKPPTAFFYTHRAFLPSYIGNVQRLKKAFFKVLGKVLSALSVNYRGKDVRIKAVITKVFPRFAVCGR